MLSQFKNHIITLLSIWFLIFLPKTVNSSENRTLQTFINYNCNPNSSYSAVNLVYGLSSVKNKTSVNYNFLSSTIGGAAGFLIAESDFDKNISIQCDKLLLNKKDSISLPPGKQNNTVGVLLKNIFFWQDFNKTGKFDPKNVIFIDTDKLIWKDVLVSNDSKRIDVTYSLNPNHLVYNGDIIIKISISATEKRYETLPNLLFTPESIHFDITFDNQKINLDNARLGLEFSLIVLNKDHQQYEYKDHEYAPKIFKILQYTFGNKTNKAFMKFHPNAYIQSNKITSQLLSTIQYEIETGNLDILKKNKMLNGFYNNNKNFNLSELQVFNLNITFGSEKEYFFLNTNYTNFNFVIGLGDSGNDQLSKFIQIVIIIGFGLSLILLLVFPVSICLIARKMRLRRDEPLANHF